MAAENIFRLLSVRPARSAQRGVRERRLPLSDADTDFQRGLQNPRRSASGSCRHRPIRRAIPA